MLVYNANYTTNIVGVKIRKLVTILFIVICVMAFGAVSVQHASAMTYETSATVGFNVKDSIKISLSGTLNIPALIIGSTIDSDPITITVYTNSENGYTLSAQMATNSTDLTSDASTMKFTGTAISSGGVSTLGSNTWGYKFSTDGATWSNYNGLPVSGSDWAVLVDTDTSPSSGVATTQVKIGANATSAFPAGDYSNTIVFYAVTKDAPVVLYMQDIADWADTEIPDVGDSTYAIDSRDGESYLVARLADGNIWMTQNLDLDLDSTKTYTSSDTDISADWTPSLSTYTTGTTTWNSSTTTPESYDPGDVCYDENTQETCTSANKSHHVGNYYNWTAAIATNDSSSYTSGTVTQSICPRGWTLPLGYSRGNGSFYYLLDQYELAYDAVSGSYSIWGSPLNLVLGGTWDGANSTGGYYGDYWLSSAASASDAHDLFFSYNHEEVDYEHSSRGSGYNIRCVAQ